MTVILFGMTLLCTAAIALDLLAIELNDVVSLDRMNAIIDAFAMMSNMFAYSYLSEFISSDLIEIGDFFYNLAWYNLSVDKQKLLVLPIQRAQRVFRLNGMGLCDCSLEFLSTVLLLCSSRWFSYIVISSFETINYVFCSTRL